MPLPSFSLKSLFYANDLLHFGGKTTRASGLYLGAQTVLPSANDGGGFPQCSSSIG